MLIAGASVLIASVFVERMPIQSYFAFLMLVIAFLVIPSLKNLVGCVKTLMGLALDKNGDKILDWSARKTLSQRR
jgi:hypothetical protein